MATVSVRYIVDDVDAAIAFYRDDLGFTEIMHPAPAFAMLSLGDLRLVLSAPGGGPGGGQAMPDGTLPRPGGWNRFSIQVTDLAGTVDRLRATGAKFRNEIVTGVGASKSWWKTRPAIPWSSSSPPRLRRGWSSRRPGNFLAAVSIRARAVRSEGREPASRPADTGKDRSHEAVLARRAHGRGRSVAV